MSSALISSWELFYGPITTIWFKGQSRNLAFPVPFWWHQALPEHKLIANIRHMHTPCFFWGTILSPPPKSLWSVQYYRWEGLKNISSTRPFFPLAKKIPLPVPAIQFHMVRLLHKCSDMWYKCVCILWSPSSFLSNLKCQRKLEAGLPLGSQSTNVRTMFWATDTAL